MKQISHCYTVAKFSEIAGFDRHSTARRLEELRATPAGTSAQGANLYHLRDLARALVGGGIEAEKLRLVKTQADRAEHDLSVRRKDYVEAAQVDKAVIWFFTNIKSTILQSPLDHRAQDEILTTLFNLKDA